MVINLFNQDSEADTCRKDIVPKLYSSNWSDEQILEQRTITPGKILVVGRIGKRKKAKKPDYILRYTQNLPLAIVEAKRKFKNASDGIQQAKDYATLLGLKFAYSSNGTEILEFDFITGIEQYIQVFPTPLELWNRLNNVEQVEKKIEDIYLKPFFPTPGKELRYYQINAINNAIKAILNGKKRVLLTLATGTGKTTVAFQIIYKLWNNRWNTKGEHRKPKVLFIADRSVLITDPHSKDFSVFGDARCLVPDEGLTSSREIYFSTYQSLAEDTFRVGAFRNLPTDFFDLIVIDECHRGSATDNSNWRNILDYFSNSVQLGLTATPLVRDDNSYTYEYFGNPLYTYTLKQGIEDGFLAPYIAHRVVTNVDATGFRPEKNQIDMYGNLIPDNEYHTPNFEKLISLLPRTRAVAKHLTDYLKKTDRFAKTIIFCVNQEHAAQVKLELNNLNTDITKENPDYIVRIVSEEGDIGKVFLDKFMDIDEEIPVIVTTSKLLSTGVDIPTCKNIVLFRIVGSMTEFKQIIGRGTRVRDDKEKLFFTILDYTGSATKNFADKEFDGEPPFIDETIIDEEGVPLDTTEISNIDENLESEDDSEEKNESEDDLDTEIEEETITEEVSTEEDSNEDGNNEEGNKDETKAGETEKKNDDTGEPPNPPPPPPRKYYVNDGKVTIVVENIQVLDENGKLRTIEYSQYVKESIKTIYPSFDLFYIDWENLSQRAILLMELENNAIKEENLRELANLPDADIFDLLCYVAYDLTPLTRKQRAEQLKINKPEFFNQYSDKAKEVLNLIIDKYIDYGLNQLKPEIITVEPISIKGNPIEIVSEFGGMEKFKNTLNEVLILLYAA